VASVSGVTFRRMRASIFREWDSSNPAFAISRGSHDASSPTPGHGRRFLACSGPRHLSDQGKPADPGTSLRVPPGCAGDTYRRLMAHYQRTATTITSAGHRKPAKAEPSGSERRAREESFTRQACLELPIDQRNGATGNDPVGLTNPVRRLTCGFVRGQRSSPHVADLRGVVRGSSPGAETDARLGAFVRALAGCTAVASTGSQAGSGRRRRAADAVEIAALRREPPASARRTPGPSSITQVL
jgi:hypothetical protein